MNDYVRLLGDRNKATKVERGSQDLSLNFRAIRSIPDTNVVPGQGVCLGLKERVGAFETVLSWRPPCPVTSACPGDNE